MLKELIFVFRHMSELKLLLKKINEVRAAVHKANIDRKIDRAELLDILREVDNVLEKVIDIVEE